jgi:hypothetical protein
MKPAFDVVVIGLESSDLLLPDILAALRVPLPSSRRKAMWAWQQAPAIRESFTLESTTSREPCEPVSVWKGVDFSRSFVRN